METMVRELIDRPEVRTPETQTAEQRLLELVVSIRGLAHSAGNGDISLKDVSESLYHYARKARA